jgi:hypothetical protein
MPPGNGEVPRSIYGEVGLVTVRNGSYPLAAASWRSSPSSSTASRCLKRWRRLLRLEPEPLDAVELDRPEDDELREKARCSVTEWLKVPVLRCVVPSTSLSYLVASSSTELALDGGPLHSTRLWRNGRGDGDGVGTGDGSSLMGDRHLPP